METKKKQKKLKKYYNWAYLWIAPAFLLMLVFSYYPPIKTLFLSFTDSTNGISGNWLGFENYKQVLFGGETILAVFKTYNVFWKSLLNVVILTAFGMIMGNIMTILLAELLYNCKSKTSSKIYRTIFVLTILVPSVVSMLIWETLVFSADGIANSILKALGLKTSLWYQGEDSVLLSIMLTGFPWVGGTSFLIYLAGLQNIPESIKEAGVLDGLGTFKRFFYIDIPYLAGQLKYFIILGIIGGLQNFSMQLIVTGGGPGSSNAAIVPGYVLYELAFSSGTGYYGMAAAVGMVIFILTLGLTILNMKRIRTTEEMTA